MKEPLKVLELFAGIGACSKALTNLGIDHEIVDAVEIDKFAIRSFNAIHGTGFEPQDITKWNKDHYCEACQRLVGETDDCPKYKSLLTPARLNVDLIMHGSPCQDFSLAGKGAGGDKGSGTRSSLMYETLRIVAKLEPKYVIWENVPAVLSKKHIHNFQSYLDRMERIGYYSFHQVLNAKDFGVPQNRKRVFTVSIRDDLDTKFSFPEPITLTKSLKDMLEPHVEDKYYLSKKQLQSLSNSGFDATKRIHSPQGISPTSTTMGGGGRQPKIVVKIPEATKCGYAECEVGGVADLSYLGSKTRRGRVKDYGRVCPTLCSKGERPYRIEDAKRVRRLTPRECWRLMGFSDQDFNRATKLNSDTQLYKQAGNSICVPVLEAIFNNLITW